MSDHANPCLGCGACCACYRVSFYWGETSIDCLDGGVPAELTGQLNRHRVYMLGTNALRSRCIALMGIIGGNVSCSIHANRPSVCRDFIPSWQDGKHHAHCDQAREQHGLSPLQPWHWRSTPPENLPRAA